MEKSNESRLVVCKYETQLHLCACVIVWRACLNILAALKGAARRPGQNMETRGLDFYIDLSVLPVPSLCDGGPGSPLPCASFSCK